MKNHKLYVIVITVACSALLSFGCLTSGDDVDTLMSGETPETLQVTTQRGGRVEVNGGSCTEVSQTDAQVNNDYLGTSYSGGTMYTYECDPESSIDDIKMHGRLGGVARKTSDLFDLGFDIDLDFSFIEWNTTAHEGVISLPIDHVLAPEAIPADLEYIGLLYGYELPVICPWMASARLLYGDSSIDPVVISDPDQDYMDLSTDPRNNPPIDVWENGMMFSFDCDDVLRIDEVTTEFDFESDSITIGYEGSTKITEGQFGGVYSNMNFAVVPFEAIHEMHYQAIEDWTATQPDDGSPGALVAEISELARCGTQTCSGVEQDAYLAVQYFLHLGWYTLSDINWADPDLQIHGLIPGAFWTKKESGNDQCEWLDTVLLSSSGISSQTVRYENFGIWDWDVQSDPDPCVSVVIWEGDGGSTTFARDRGWISTTDIADDFVGFFKICESDVLGGSFGEYNYSGDLYIEFSMGDTVCTP